MIGRIIIRISQATRAQAPKIKVQQTSMTINMSQTKSIWIIQKAVK